MSVSRKILLIALSFALPIAVLVYLTVINIDANITFAQWELKGDEYQRPLEELLHCLQSEQITLHSSGIKAAAETSKKIDSLPGSTKTSSMGRLRPRSGKRSTASSDLRVRKRRL